MKYKCLWILEAGENEYWSTSSGIREYNLVYIYTVILSYYKPRMRSGLTFINKNYLNQTAAKLQLTA